MITRKALETLKVLVYSVMRPLSFLTLNVMFCSFKVMSTNTTADLPIRLSFSDFLGMCKVIKEEKLNKPQRWKFEK